MEGKELSKRGNRCKALEVQEQHVHRAMEMNSVLKGLEEARDGKFRGLERGFPGWNSSSATALGPWASHLASLSSNPTIHMVIERPW